MMLPFLYLQISSWIGHSKRFPLSMVILIQTYFYISSTLADICTVYLVQLLCSFRIISFVYLLFSWLFLFSSSLHYWLLGFTVKPEHCSRVHGYYGNAYAKVRRKERTRFLPRLFARVDMLSILDWYRPEQRVLLLEALLTVYVRTSALVTALVTPPVRASECLGLYAQHFT